MYDGSSRLRISREYTWDDSAWVLLPNSEKRRIYDGMDVIQERDGTNAVIATYVRDGNIGGILSERDSEDDNYFFHYDGRGNVVGLTDEEQNSVAEYTYDAYGNLLSSSGAQASNNLYRYSTKEYFTHAGLYNYRYRFYSSGLGRWINRDPIAEAGGLNLYGFVGNTPLNAGDAYGLWRIAEPSTWFDGNGFQGTGLEFNIVDFAKGVDTGTHGLASSFTFGMLKTGRECDIGFNGSYISGSIAREALTLAMGGPTAL